jgi:membrane-associated protease RseP (regulator of RpoE activity)
MKKARLRVMLHVFAFAISAATASAQTSDDCRCVDPQGTAIENCSCFRASPFQGFLQGFAPQADARPRIGISVDAQQSARNDARGARVTSLMEDGPADAAGIRVGDMITSVDGHSLFEALAGNAEEDFDLDASIPVQRLLAISADLEAGQEVEVEYVHSGESQTATLAARELSSWENDSLGNDSRRSGFARPTLERFRNQLRGVPGVPDVPEVRGSFEFRFDQDEMREHQRELRENVRELAERAQQEARRSTLRLYAPQSPEIHVFGGPDMSATIAGDSWSGNLYAIGMGRIHGIDLLEMKPGLAAYFGTEEGMLVTNVNEDSTLGLEPGDVILSIGDREATSSSRIRRILSTYDEDENITLRIMRDHDEMTVTGRLSG